MGIWSCLGTDLGAVSAGLRAGRCGIGFSEERVRYGYHSGLVGVVERPVIGKELLDRHTRASLSEPAEYAYMAACQAFAQAGIGEGYRAENEIGCVFGNDSSFGAVVDTHEVMRAEGDTAMLGSGRVFRGMNSTVTMNLGAIFGLRGVNFTVSAACASGSHAIGLGAMLIERGQQDVVLCGGAQEVNCVSSLSFDAIGALSRRNGDPGRASRPFDVGRDGLVPSGGGAALVLESYEHAVGRGARILAEVAGYGFSGNGSGNLSEPCVEGCVVAMRRALVSAGIGAGDVDYINAHATSTRRGDLVEAMAIDEVFGRWGTAVSSTKGMTGHECWMAGASEVVYCVLMMEGRFMAPNINYENGDEFSERLNIVRVAREGELRCVLSNSFGFGGTNSSLVLRRV